MGVKIVLCLEDTESFGKNEGGIGKTEAQG
jgi:hypothetical protein